MTVKTHPIHVLFVAVLSVAFFNGCSAIVVCEQAASQPTWQQTYDLSKVGYARDIVSVSDGGLLAALELYGGSSGDTTLQLLRTDGGGNTIWATDLITDRNLEPVAVVETPDGGFAVAGTAYRYDDRDDLYLARVNADGDLLWARTYPRNELERALSLANREGGGFLVGTLVRFPDYGEHATARTLDDNGDVVETWDYSAVGASVLAMVPDYDESWAILTLRGEFSRSELENEAKLTPIRPQLAELTRVDPNGATVWTKEIGETYYGASVALTPSGIIGATTDVSFLRFAPDGTLLSRKLLPHAFRSRMIKSDSEENFYVGGQMTFEGALAVCTNVAVVVYDAGGQQLWEKSYNVGFQDYLYGIAPTEDGGCILGWSPRDRLTLLRADADVVR